MKPRTEKYKFLRIDNGKCRVYYTKNRYLYCIQDDGAWGERKLTFYVCSKDGEPSHEKILPAKDEFDRYVEP